MHKIIRIFQVFFLNFTLLTSHSKPHIFVVNSAKLLLQSLQAIVGNSLVIVASMASAYFGSLWLNRVPVRFNFFPTS